MFKQNISISLNGETDKQACFDGFETLLAAYMHSGQVVGDYEPLFIDDHVLKSYITTLSPLQANVFFITGPRWIGQ